MCGDANIGTFIEKRLPKTGGGTKQGLLNLFGPGISADIGQAKSDLESVGLKKPTKPFIDPEAQRAAAAAEAQTQANARIAFQRKAQRDNSLLTGGGAAAAGSGRSTLGV